MYISPVYTTLDKEPCGFLLYNPYDKQNQPHSIYLYW